MTSGRLKRMFFLGLLVLAVGDDSSNSNNKVQIAQTRLHFERLWDMLGGNQDSRGPSQGRSMDVKHVCQYGLNNLTHEVARFLLASARPPIAALEVHDLDVAMGAPRMASHLMTSLESQFGDRVRHGMVHESTLCDAVVFSEAAPRFSIERILPRLGTQVVVALVSHSCILDEKQIQTPVCNHMNVLWEKTSLLKWGRCSGSVCMSYLPIENLNDPNLLKLRCDEFSAEDGSKASVSEFGQDWFLFWNFFANDDARKRGEGVYVDVGASLPFEYSNTAFFDRCLGWKGVCVEPNPFLTTFLKTYRSCQVFQNCVDVKKVHGKPFSYPDGLVAFGADCLPLGTVLERAGLKGRRIDVLSIDVEHNEMKVLQSFRMQDFDIRFIVIEVTQGARWLEVDTALLPEGYAKVAVIGRDVVYAKLEEVSSGAFAAWPFLSKSDGKAQLPEEWSSFHQRVVDEELEQEAQKEKEAFDNGLRRR